jgi:subtilisin-like proprotein convertase family protein
VDSVSGRVSWNTTHVPAGDWSLLVLVTDVITGATVPAEYVLRVMPAAPSVVPQMALPLVQLHPVQFGFPLQFSVQPADANDTVQVASFLPDTASFSAANEFSWTPASSSIGTHVICFQASRPAAGTVSAPACRIIVVGLGATAMPSVSIAAAATFTANRDANVVLDAAAVVSSSTFITQLVAQLTGVRDGSDEQLFFKTPVASALAVKHLTRSSLIVRGRASASVYQNVLRSLAYAHSGTRPTVGERQLLVSVSTASGLQTAMPLALDVRSQNTVPEVRLDAPGLNYSTVFFASGPPLPLSPPAGVVLADNTSHLAQARYQLQPMLDRELLTVSHIPPPMLDAPISRGVANQFLRFGNATPSVTSIVSITDVPATVSDVDVVVHVRHSWIGDLQLTLTHLGRSEVLTLAPGSSLCSQDDLTNTVFDQGAPTTLDAAPGRPGICQFQSRGAFRPAGNLDVFNGFDANGDWALTIDDLQPAKDDGVLLGWAVVLRTGPVSSVHNAKILTPIFTTASVTRGRKKRMKTKS